MNFPPAIQQAIAIAQDRIQFDPNDLNAVEVLTLEGGAGPLGDLKALPCLTDLTVSYWRDLELPALPPSVYTLHCDHCELTSLAPIAGHPGLKYVEFPQCLIQDLAPLGTLPKLRRVRTMGNPLTEASYRTLMPALEARGVRLGKGDRRLQDQEWAIMDRLRSRGILLCAIRDAWDKTRVMQPAADLSQLAVLSLEDVDDLLTQHPDVDTADAFMVEARKLFHQRIGHSPS
jgi:hypothetical protein